MTRFWALTTPEPNTGCWLWAGSCDRKGYGSFKAGPGRTVRANRFSLELKLGRKLTSDEEAAHSCDTPGCVGWDHLFAATRQENEDDKTAKGRRPHEDRIPPDRRARGVRIGTAKLDAADVAEIRRRYRDGNVTKRDLGAEFGVSDRHVGGIVRGEFWKTEATDG